MITAQPQDLSTMSTITRQSRTGAVPRSHWVVDCDLRLSIAD